MSMQIKSEIYIKWNKLLDSTTEVYVRRLIFYVVFNLTSNLTHFSLFVRNIS